MNKFLKIFAVLAVLAGIALGIMRYFQVGFFSGRAADLENYPSGRGVLPNGNQNSSQ